MLPSSLPRVLPIALHSLLPEALATVHLPEQKTSWSTRIRSKDAAARERFQAVRVWPTAVQHAQQNTFQPVSYPAIKHRSRASHNAPTQEIRQRALKQASQHDICHAVHVLQHLAICPRRAALWPKLRTGAAARRKFAYAILQTRAHVVGRVAVFCTPPDDQLLLLVRRGVPSRATPDNLPLPAAGGQSPTAVGCPGGRAARHRLLSALPALISSSASTAAWPRSSPSNAPG